MAVAGEHSGGQPAGLGFACMARPVVVDVTRGDVGCFRGNAALGRLYSGHLRRKLDLYFPATSARVSG